ncbi:MAG: GIY-YIG nuclease family protein [Bacteroidetes bacterium]|nr:GIY-YIG nuclease family protein [Bacteroidota bacterium]
MSQPVFNRGFSVCVFLPDGNPDGIKVVEKSNWSGCGLVVPRALFGEAKTRPELTRTGVYVLVGQAELSPLPQVYVGEGDPVRPRLEQHSREKDFWTHVVVFTSKDQNLNKAHVQHLESRLVRLAGASKRCVLDNGNVPQAPSLSEADTAAVEGFLADMMLCLPILGYGFFESAPAVAPRVVLLTLTAKGIKAHGFESPNGFVVRAGSMARKEDQDAPSMHAFLKWTRADLVRQGVLVDRGATYELAQDYEFSSPSTAAGVLLGRSCNGRMQWRTADGRTLKSLQDAEAGA